MMPFLRNVTAGRGVPDERLAKVAEHYYEFGGVSPINAQCRELLAAIEKDFAATGLDLPVYWGNRNWRPYLADTLAAMAADGIERAIALATSAYSSFSSCRQYLDDIDRAQAAVQAAGGAGPEVIKIPPYYRHPGFIGSFIDSTAAALGSLPAEVAEGAELIFTAHSIPISMATASGPAGGAYAAQLAVVAEAVTSGVGRSSWRLAYQSRSGPPSVPWLEPDINDSLEEVAASGASAAVVVPIGFVSDHMEIKFDLDTEAAQTAARLGLPLARAATPGTAPRFVSMISALAAEFASGQAGPAAEALGPAAASFCRAGCCGSDLNRSAALLATNATSAASATGPGNDRA